MGTLYIVSTPIGNLEDITIRALKTLFSVDVIACEDTRKTGQLLELLRERYHALIRIGNTPTYISYRDANEDVIVGELIQKLESNMTIALISDAGTPLISDPGYRLVEASVKRNIPIEVIPGVTAFQTALTGSGLTQNAFMFIGYLPEKQGKRKIQLQILKQSPLQSVTYITYVAPHKLGTTLDDMKEVFGNISIVIARELTKIHEEYFRGSIEEAQEYLKEPKGELVLLFTI